MNLRNDEELNWPKLGSVELTANKMKSTMIAAFDQLLEKLEHHKSRSRHYPKPLKESIESLTKKKGTIMNLLSEDVIYKLDLFQQELFVMRYLNLAATTFDFDYEKNGIFVNLPLHHPLYLQYNELDDMEKNWQSRLKFICT